MIWYSNHLVLNVIFVVVPNYQSKMKTYLTSFVILFAVLACSSDNSPSPETELKSSCDYDSRKTVSTLINQLGTIRLTLSGNETWVDIFVDGDSNTRYCACNLPNSYSEVGFRIQFNADVKEIYANEKWRCQPIKLTTLTAISTKSK
jgi:hypothetical protein